jgi:hypothetical protein
MSLRPQRMPRRGRRNRSTAEVARRLPPPAQPSPRERGREQEAAFAPGSLSRICYLYRKRKS